MKRYHGQATPHTFPPNVKPAPVDDVRDRWRLQVAADPDLGPGALRVALVLLNFANRSGFTSVGVDRIATDGQRDRRNVERGLRQLVARGHLEREAGGGVPGRGGRTCATLLKVIHKVPAAASSKVPATDAEVPATAHRSTGDGGPKVPATVAGETLLTHKPPAADGPGLEAGTSTAKNDDTGSATAGPGGEVLRMLDDLTTSPRSEPRSVRDVVLSAIRARLGHRPQRPGSDNENSVTATGCGGSGVGVLYAK